MLARALAVVEMGQNALDHGRIFDARNDLHLPTTGSAGLYIDLEHARQTLRPGHCRVAVCRGLICGHRVPPSASGRSHLLMLMKVGGRIRRDTPGAGARAWMIIVLVILRRYVQRYARELACPSIFHERKS